MQTINMNRQQLGALERFFGGYRDRVVTVAQELGSDRATFCVGREPVKGHVCAALTLAEVEALIVATDATGTHPIINGALET